MSANLAADLEATARRHGWLVTTRPERYGRSVRLVIAARRDGTEIRIETTAGNHTRIRLAEFTRPGRDGSLEPEDGGRYDLSSRAGVVRGWLRGRG